MSRFPLPTSANVPCPDGIKPFQLASQEEQLRRAHVVLVDARELYRNRFGTLNQCVQTAGHGLIQAEYARRLLRTLMKEPYLPQWEAHPARRRADIYKLLDAAIRRSKQLKGGWLVAVSGGVR